MKQWLKVELPRVIVGDKSDIGGGASTLGTLSGGNEVIISIGEVVCWVQILVWAFSWGSMHN